MTLKKILSSKTCRFKRKYIHKDNTFTLSFIGLSSYQADIVSCIFRSLFSCGVVYTHSHGFTLPELELRCSVPLERVSGSSLIVPNSAISALTTLFSNNNFTVKDVIVSSTGVPLSNLNTY